MAISNIETHIRRIELVKSLGGWILEATKIYTGLLRLRGVDSASLQKTEKEILENHNTRTTRLGFIEEVHTLSEKTLRTRDLDEASKLITGFATEPDSFSNAMRRQDVISRLIRERE